MQLVTGDMPITPKRTPKRNPRCTCECTPRRKMPVMTLYMSTVERQATAGRGGR